LLTGCGIHDPKPALRDPYADYVAEGMLDHLANG
jgi:hypothetical protein